MLLWKTSPSPSVRAEITRQSQPRVRRVLLGIRKISRESEHDVAASVEGHGHLMSRDDEDRYIVKIVLMMLLVLVVPAILLLLYIVFTSDPFQYDITPKQDFSSWHPGKSL